MEICIAVITVVGILVLVRYNYVRLGVPATFFIAIVFLLAWLWFGLHNVDMHDAETGKTLMEATALLAAAIFFSYQALSGLFVASLRLNVETERWHPPAQAKATLASNGKSTADNEFIALRIRIKGSGENAIELRHISVGWFEFDVEKKIWIYASTDEVPIARLDKEPPPSDWKEQDWRQSPKLGFNVAKYIALSGSDEVEYGVVHLGSIDKAYKAEVRVDGKGLGHLDPSQWRASAISLPEQGEHYVLVKKDSHASESPDEKSAKRKLPFIERG